MSFDQGHNEPPQLAEDIKNTHMFTGIGAIFGFGWLVALIMYLNGKDKHPALRAEGANQLNFQLSMLIYATAASIIGSILLIVLIGFIFYIVPFVAWLMGFILPFMAMGRRGYKFPLTINMVK